MSLQLLPRNWFRDENITVLAARSSFLSDKQRVGIRDASQSFLKILHWCWRSAKDAQHFFTLLSVMRRIFASGFRAGFVLPFRWIRSELNCFDEGSRIIDRNKSLLLVLAHEHATKTAFVPHCTWVSVKLTLHLISLCRSERSIICTIQ